MLALQSQNVTVRGNADFGRDITGVATQLREVPTRQALAPDLEARLEAHPLAHSTTRSGARRGHCRRDGPDQAHRHDEYEESTRQRQLHGQHDRAADTISHYAPDDTPGP